MKLFVHRNLSSFQVLLLCFALALSYGRCAHFSRLRELFSPKSSDSGNDLKSRDSSDKGPLPTVGLKSRHSRNTPHVSLKKYHPKKDYESKAEEENPEYFKIGNNEVKFIDDVVKPTKKEHIRHVGLQGDEIKDLKEPTRVHHVVHKVLGRKGISEDGKELRENRESGNEREKAGQGEDGKYKDTEEMKKIEQDRPISHHHHHPKKGEELETKDQEHKEVSADEQKMLAEMVMEKLHEEDEKEGKSEGTVIHHKVHPHLHHSSKTAEDGESEGKEKVIKKERPGSKDSGDEKKVIHHHEFHATSEPKHTKKEYDGDRQINEDDLKKNYGHSTETGSKKKVIPEKVHTHPQTLKRKDEKSWGKATSSPTKVESNENAQETSKEGLKGKEENKIPSLEEIQKKTKENKFKQNQDLVAKIRSSLRPQIEQQLDMKKRVERPRISKTSQPSISEDSLFKREGTNKESPLSQPAVPIQSSTTDKEQNLKTLLADRYGENKPYRPMHNTAPITNTFVPLNGDLNIDNDRSDVTGEKVPGQILRASSNSFPQKENTINGLPNSITNPLGELMSLENDPKQKPKLTNQIPNIQDAYANQFDEYSNPAKKLQDTPTQMQTEFPGNEPMNFPENKLTEKTNSALNDILYGEDKKLPALSVNAHRARSIDSPPYEPRQTSQLNLGGTEAKPFATQQAFEGGQGGAYQRLEAGKGGGEQLIKPITDNLAYQKPVSQGPGWSVYEPPNSQIGVRTSRDDVAFVPLGEDDKEQEEERHANTQYFSELDDSQEFEIPDLHVNCWLQAMMSSDWGFGPSCIPDGSYGPKQCHQKRCWCVNSRGEKVRLHGGKNNDGYFYGLQGLTLYCAQNL